MNLSQRLAMREEKINWETYKIDNLTDLEGLIMELPRAAGQPVYILDQELTDKKTITEADIGEVTLDKLRLDPKHKAVVNMNTRLAAQIAGSGYQILDHGSFYACLVDEFRARGLDDAHGYMIVGNGGNQVKVRLIFNDRVIDEPGYGHNIRFGGEFANSYDSAYAARGHAFFLRISCFNQFVARNVIPECVFSRAHSAPTQRDLLEAVTFQIKDFMENLDEMGMTFKKHMLSAIEDEVIIESPEQIDMFMRELVRGDVHADAISSIIKRQARVSERDPRFHVTNRWEMLQAVTQYASHEYTLSPAVQDQLFYKAETGIFKGPIELPTVPAN